MLTKCRLLYPEARIVLATYWNTAVQSLAALRESPLGGMGHACELETSLVMATKPALVQTDRMQPDGGWSQSEFLGKDMLSGGEASVSRAFADISKNGGIGDPRSATAEKGERFYNAIVERLVALIHDLESEKIDHILAVGS